MSAMEHPLTADESDAFRASCFARERIEGQLLMGLAAPVYISWVAFDYYLEPKWLLPFLALRLFFTASAVALVFAMRRARTLAAIRLYVGLGFFLAGALIAVMLPRVEHSYPLYVFGYSLIFWIMGIGTSWPPRHAALVQALVLAAYVLALVTYDGPRTRQDIIGTFFFVGTASIFSIVSCAVRLRLQERAFFASRALAEKNDELSRTLATLGETQARLAASEKLSALGRLLGGLSHEINNPINVIHNNLGPVREYAATLTALAELARAEVPSGGKFDQAWREREGDFVVKDTAPALATIDTAVQRLRAVHADLRAFIRGDAPTMEQGDLNEGIRSTVQMIARNLKPDVKVTCALAQLPPTVFQPGQLNQVWLNLLQNAMDAVGDRGEIQVETRTAEDKIEVEVRDTGTGIDPKIKDHLFEPFMTTKGVGKGTGLGLAVSYQIIKNHQGQIRAENAKPTGARFIVTLPLRQTA